MLEESNHHSDHEWSRTLTDPVSFAYEQARLGQLWTLLGLTTDVPSDGDWFRATLGGRSVFVQRFGDEIRGFENLCVHRFHPLRIKDRGNGPIRCGFHHWQYNKEGFAIGIPKCQEMFGVTPRELGARLTSIEVSTCGILIFGRFISEEHIDTLEQSFGDGFSILQSMCNLQRTPSYFETNISANWKLVYHISLDDYHIVAVHPDTFGKDGYLPIDEARYFRFGRHSAYFLGGSDDDLAKMADECRRSEYRPMNYRIFQFFPNLLVAHFEAAKNWYVLIQQYVPVAPDRCLSRCWYFLAPFPPADRTWLHGVLRRIVAPFVPFVLPFYIRKIFSEDNTVCEQIQTVAHQIERFPLLGRHEERIAWFEDAYAKTMTGTQAERPNTVEQPLQKG